MLSECVSSSYDVRTTVPFLGKTLRRRPVSVRRIVTPTISASNSCLTRSFQMIRIATNKYVVFKNYERKGVCLYLLMKCMRTTSSLHLSKSCERQSLCFSNRRCHTYDTSQ